MPTQFPITVLHPRPDVCDAIRPAFAGLNTTVECGRVEQLTRHIDVIVTAGNSYGIMTAGFDAAVIERAGEQLMERVQDHIVGAYLGEQPVGSAFALTSGSATFDQLVHAPTMRTPGAITEKDVVYTATWAALLCCYRLQRVVPSREVLLPLMGTGFGVVSPVESARQMAVAIRHLRNPQRVRDWDIVTRRERRILG